MSQNINLINPSLIRKKTYRNALTMAGSYSTLGLLMLLCYSTMQYQTLALAQASKHAAQQLQQLQRSLDQVNTARAGELAHKQPNAGLQIELAQLGEQQKMQAQLLQTLRQDDTKQHTVADYLRGFASRTMPGVWLTAFSVDSSGTISLRGRCLQAALLPAYMNSLGREAVFSGRLFSGLHIGLPSASDSRESARQPYPDASALSDSKLATPGGEAGRQPVTAGTPSFLEFELQGLQAPTAGTPTGMAPSASGKS